MGNLNRRLRFGILGGVLGGVIAVIGYWIFSPPVDSILLFVALRMLIGAVVAMIVGPLILSGRTKNGAG